MQPCKLILFGLIPLCFIAGIASGGWYVSWSDNEAGYVKPVHYSFEFYKGLRWSVMLVGGIMAMISYCWKHRKLSLLFGFVAVLFNPVIPIHLPKDAWEAIDTVAGWVFLVGPAYLLART